MSLTSNWLSKMDWKEMVLITTTQLPITATLSMIHFTIQTTLTITARTTTGAIDTIILIAHQIMPVVGPKSKQTGLLSPSGTPFCTCNGPGLEFDSFHGLTVSIWINIDLKQKIATCLPNSGIIQNQWDQHPDQEDQDQILPPHSPMITIRTIIAQHQPLLDKIITTPDHLQIPT